MNRKSTPQPTLKDLLASKREGKSEKRKKEQSSTVLHFGRAILLVLLLIAPWCIGSVHILPQMVLLGGITVVLAAWWVDFAFFAKSGKGLIPYVFIPVFLGWILAISQLTPLSDSVAAILAPKQHEIYTEYTTDENLVRVVDESPDSKDNDSLITEARAITAPTTISMDVDQTARYAGLIVLASGCLLAGSYFFKSATGVLSLLWVMSFNGAAISAYGIYEKFYPTEKVLGFYTLLYGGVPFGPYVNRNNAAGFLLICLGCAIGLIYLSLQKRKSLRPKPVISKEMPAWRQFNLAFADFIAELTIAKALSIVFTAIIACGVIATLSRGGTIGGLAGGLTSIFLFALARKPKSSLGIFALVVIITAATAGYLGFGKKLTERIDQFSSAQIDDIQRYQNWQDTWSAVDEFGIAGSGLGAYHAVHRLYRSDDETKLYEYAENQYYQTLIEAGWVGVVLLVSCIAITVICISHLLRHGQSSTTIAMGLVGIFVLTSVGVASTFDFGLYLSANMCSMAVVVGVICGNAHWHAQRITHKTILRFALPNIFTAILGMTLFAASIYYTMYFYRIYQVEKIMTASPLTQNSDSLDWAETERLITELEPMALKTPTARGYQQLGELYQHRYRLEEMSFFVGSRKFANTKEDAELKSQFWRETNLDRLHAWLCAPRIEGDLFTAATRKNTKRVKDNLIKAREYFKRSRNRMPLQPETHMLLGYLEPISNTPERDEIHIERATILAPSNANLHFIAGKLHLQAGRETEACIQWNRCLEIASGRYFKTICSIASLVIEPDRIFTEVLPRNPKNLYDYGNQFLTSAEHNELRELVFETAEELLANRSATDFNALVLSANVKFAINKNTEAVDELGRAVVLRPNDYKLRERYAKQLFKIGEYKKAHAQSTLLVKSKPENTRYRSLFSKTKAKAD